MKTLTLEVPEPLTGGEHTPEAYSAAVTGLMGPINDVCAGHPVSVVCDAITSIYARCSTASAREFDVESAGLLRPLADRIESGEIRKRYVKVRYAN